MSKWISIKEHLPNCSDVLPSVSVLVYCNSKNSKFVAEAVYYQMDKSFHEPYCGQEDTTIYKNVTHWMLMPKPPIIKRTKRT